jgi:hypothetical protein
MHQVFVEVADEITTVIERLKAAPGDVVALVVPKGAILLQSVVNLKLVKKAATDAHKNVTLVTTDKIGHNLATQVGIPIATSLEEIGSEATNIGEQEAKVIGGVKIHRYYDKDADTPAQTGDSAALLIPKPLLQKAASEEPTEVVAEEISPIVVRSITTEEPTEHTSAVELISAPLAQVAFTPPVSEPPSPPRMPSAKRTRRLVPFLAFLIVLVLIAGASISTLYYPKTQVMVHVPAEPWTKEITSGAAVNQPIQGTDRLTTAQLVSVEPSETLDFKATGSKDIGNTATGTVDMLNYQNSDSQSLASGAKLSANGVNFVTTADVSVPGFRRQNGTDIPGSAKVAVQAVTAGDVGNVTAPSVAIVSPSSQLTARNLTTTGGTSKTVTVVTDTDIANAKIALTKQLDTDTLNQLNEQVSKTTNFGNADSDTFKLEDSSSTVAAGDQVNGGTENGKAIRKRVVISQDDLKKSVTALGQGDGKAGTTFTLDKVTITAMHGDVDKGTATYTFQAAGSSTQSVSLDVIRKQILGKSVQNGTDLIRSIIPDAIVEIKQSPTWWPFKHIPRNSRFVTVDAKNE